MMKKLVVLLLLMVSTNVFAEWTEVNGNKDAGLTTYVDYGTIKNQNNKVKIWTLYDYKRVQQVEDSRFLSSVTHTEYNCEEETSRMLDVYWYSGNMRNGEIVWSSTNIKKETVSIIPESIDEGNFNIACGKK
jgi:hypothetical protein